MKIQVAYGNKHGATGGIAHEIGRTLDQDGFDAVVVPGEEVRNVSDFDAVVPGSSLYAGHWHRDALRCAHDHAEALARRPVWLFSSGPVDSSAEQHDIPPVHGATTAMRQLHSRRHVTFGGSITASADQRAASTTYQVTSAGFRYPLPFHQHLTDDDIHHVTTALQQALTSTGARMQQLSVAVARVGAEDAGVVPAASRHRPGSWVRGVVRFRWSGR
ncbi:hypothetical protein J5Y04_13860 [Kitasatospora sp. RG8]|uniref:flavodoxin domain-containing protein n=1 Tax=Kitasatospora sp. RG8 TaxID=2820815 RepID=UPI001ADEDAA0|nr:flavodoxin domain-containing protein [Kitasatospora sp. RG8]MBP0450622.1 hypothetical protein [Kitasatospora sp. RG8]